MRRDHIPDKTLGSPAHHEARRLPLKNHQPAGEPDEPITQDHSRETKPLTLDPMGCPYRRAGRGPFIVSVRRAFSMVAIGS